MKLKIKRIFTIGLIFSSLVFTGQSCTRAGQQANQIEAQPIDLEYWTVFNSPNDYQDIIAAYQAQYPNIRINIRKFRFEEYESMLTNALAEDRGPDIFSVHNTEIRAFRRRLLPLPDVTNMVASYETGGLNSETVSQIQSVPSLNEFDLRQQYVEQVYQDAYIDSLVYEQGEETIGPKQIYGLPLSFDSMVMYFNRDILDNGGVAEPAKTWDEFQDHIENLVKFDSQGEILTAGAVMGTADTVIRPTDILTLLMMQSGAEMITDNNIVNFNRIPDSLRGRSTVPAEDALLFYTSFANPNQRYYTWDDDLGNGLEAFLQGRSAYFFGYHYHQEQINGLAPSLNYGVANMPQISGNPEVNFANYWLEGVSRKTLNPDAAWNFVQFMTSNSQSQSFLQRTGKPTARRDLIQSQLDNPDLIIWAKQLLTSKSWYTGNNIAAAETVLKNLINSTLLAEDELDDLLDLAAQRVQQTMNLPSL